MSARLPNAGDKHTQQAAAHAAPLIAGIDEAGRGPLAGPVVVAAVVFCPTRARINGLDDSKKLSPARRELLHGRIMERALARCVVFVEVADIDRLNIYHATMHGMRLALQGVVDALGGAPCIARIDGNALPRELPCPAEAWIGGDARDRSIMAASILAKVARDAHMQALHARWPQYGFDRHKGYGSPAHLAALRAHGPCPEHRRSYAPVYQNPLFGELPAHGDGATAAAAGEGPGQARDTPG